MFLRFLFYLSVSLVVLGSQACMSLFPPEPSTQVGEAVQAEQSNQNQPARVSPQNSNPVSAQPVAMSAAEQELKMAKLWSRVDELETRMIKQEEKISLLKRGLMLGIVPEQLRDGAPRMNSSSPSRMRQEEIVEEPSSPTSMVDLDESEDSESAVRRDDSGRRISDAGYQSLLRDAQAQFNQGNYGQAIALYQQISKDYPDKTNQGQHLFWIGLSWYYLKEDQLAEESFKSLLDEYAGSPWVGKSRFYVAKIDLRRGYRQRALAEFQKLIEDFSGKDLEEMARFEVQRLKETL